MLGAVLLILVGSADVIRSYPRLIGRGSRVILLTTVVWAGVISLVVWGLGIALWWVAIPLAVAILWVGLTSPADNTRASAGIVPAVGLFVAMLAFVGGDRTAITVRGFLVDWHSTTPSELVRDVPLPTLFLGVGVVLFAIESANIVVRAALRPAQADVVAAPRLDPVVRRWWSRAAREVPVITDLRGGRLIGPLERLLIVALTLAGFLPIVAGLFAAKGIVRFPEISSDGANGSKAEYFLVGSLVSWTLAFAGAGLLWISAHS